MQRGSARQGFCQLTIYIPGTRELVELVPRTSTLNSFFSRLKPYMYTQGTVHTDWSADEARKRLV